MSLAGKLMRYGVDTLPHVQYMLKNNLECKVYWGLFDKISPAFELRNSGAPAVVLRPFRLRVIERGHSRDCRPPLYQRY